MSFEKKCMKLGITTMTCAVIANFIPAIYVWIAYGVTPPMPDMGAIFSMVAASFAIGWIVQPITYYPAIGTGASFLSWTTGNVAELRMPVIASVQKATNVEGGTKEGDVISTMATAISNYVTVILITIFSIAGKNILSSLPESVVNSFGYLVPALFGALICDYLMKNIKYNGTLFIGAIICFFVFIKLGLSSIWIILLTVVISMFISRGVYVFDTKKRQ